MESSYHVRILDGAVARSEGSGQRMVITGPRGCGKSTLIENHGLTHVEESEVLRPDDYKVRMRMYPMTLFESGKTSGEVSLASLFTGDHEI